MVTNHIIRTGHVFSSVLCQNLTFKWNIKNLKKVQKKSKGIYSIDLKVKTITLKKEKKKNWYYLTGERKK